MSAQLRTQISVGFLLLGISVAVALNYFKKQPTKAEIAEPKILVSVDDIRPYSGPIHMDLTGLVVPFREISIVAEVTGRVTYKSEDFRPGRFVSAGTVLMKVDQTDYDLDIARLEADLDQSAAAINELEVEINGISELVKLAANDLKLQESDLARKQDPRAGYSLAELEQAQRAVLASQNALATQVNRLSLLEQGRARLASGQTIKRTDLELARIRRSRCVITAPADGVVVTENVELNGFVQPGAVIMVFEDTSRAEVRCNLRTDQLEWLWRHAPDAEDAAETPDGGGAAYRLPRVPVRLTHGSGPEALQWDGTLDRFDGLGVDDRTKTIPCRIVVPNPIAVGPRGPRALVRGMFVNITVELPTEPLKRLNQFFATIPAKGLLAGNNVWLLRDGRLTTQEVRVVNTLAADSTDLNVNSEDARRVVIQLSGDGPQMTDRIVTSPVGTYTRDMKVELLSGENSATPAAQTAEKNADTGLVPATTAGSTDG